MEYGKFVRGIFTGSKVTRKRDNTIVIDIALACGVDSYRLRCRDNLHGAAAELKFGQSVECMVSTWRSNDGNLSIDFADSLKILSDG